MKRQSEMKEVDFITETREKAQAKVEEIKRLRHELNRIEMEIARAKIYIFQLNDFLKKS